MHMPSQVRHGVRKLVRERLAVRHQHARPMDWCWSVLCALSCEPAAPLVVPVQHTAAREPPRPRAQPRACSERR